MINWLCAAISIWRAVIILCWFHFCAAGGTTRHLSSWIKNFLDRTLLSWTIRKNQHLFEGPHRTPGQTLPYPFEKPCILVWHYKSHTSVSVCSSYISIITQKLYNGQLSTHPPYWLQTVVEYVDLIFKVLYPKPELPHTVSQLLCTCRIYPKYSTQRWLVRYTELLTYQREQQQI